MVRWPAVALVLKEGGLLSAGMYVVLDTVSHGVSLCSPSSVVLALTFSLFVVVVSWPPLLFLAGWDFAVRVLTRLLSRSGCPGRY